MLVNVTVNEPPSAVDLTILLLSLNSESWLGGYRMGFELLIINSLICFFLLFLSSIGNSRA